jgi:prevent-host-death family protein
LIDYEDTDMPGTGVVKAVPAFDAKTHFGQLLDEVDREGVRFIIERRGKPVAVILGINEFEEMLEVAGEEADPLFQESLHEAHAEYKLGRTISLDTLKRINDEADDNA